MKDDKKPKPKLPEKPPLKTVEIALGAKPDKKRRELEDD